MKAVTANPKIIEGKDMLAIDKIKMRAFVRCMKEDGVDKFINYLMTNAENGFVYHRNGVMDDYDLSTEEHVLELLRGAK